MLLSPACHLTMSDTQIRDTLQRLHTVLQSQPQLDPELKSLLQTLDQDIQTALDHKHSETATASESTDLAEQAQALATRFAAEHPNIDLALRELRSLLLGVGL
jgi:type II secretory pathway component PulJ